MCEEHSPHSPLQSRAQGRGRPRRVMPIELIRAGRRGGCAAHGLREIIPSTMGEPLLYEHFEEILDLCATHGVKLNLTTNGTFPRLGARAWAERIVPVTSDVKISWNGATKATHEAIMLGARWEKVLENVRTFIAVRDAHARERRQPLPRHVPAHVPRDATSPSSPTSCGSRSTSASTA